MQRFWDKVKTSKACWLWTGCKDNDGFGLFWNQGACRRAHRISYELATQAELAPGDVIIQRCGNRLCVSPHHLERGEQRRQRHRGSHHGRAKLTEADVLRMRDAAAQGASCRQLAELYGVTRATVSRIVRRRIWTHI